MAVAHCLALVRRQLDLCPMARADPASLPLDPARGAAACGLQSSSFSGAVETGLARVGSLQPALRVVDVCHGLLVRGDLEGRVERLELFMDARCPSGWRRQRVGTIGW